MSTLTFSDSESTGDSRDTVDGSQLEVCQYQYRSHDDVWMQEVMDELDEFMQNAPVNMLLKWRNIKTLTTVYYNGLKETQAELEQESKKAFVAQEALQRVTSALEEVAAQLEEVQAERDALQAHQRRIHELVQRETENWEVVYRSDEESE